MNLENKQQAFDAIHEVAVALLGLLREGKTNEVEKGLNLIISLARYQFDVRGEEDREKI
jgi:hypothetical protein